MPGPRQWRPAPTQSTEPNMCTPQPNLSVDPQNTLGNAAIQDQLRGRGLCTPFGDFEVVPEDQGQCAVPTVPGTEVISEGELTSGYDQWDHVEADDTNLTIDPADINGDVHPDFPQQGHEHLRQLMQTREGRQIIDDAQNGPLPTTLVPTPGEGDHPQTRTLWDGVAAQDGTPSPGAPAIIEIPENLQPQTVMAEDGTHFEVPPEVVVGHEINHANHDTRGTNAMLQPPSDEVYDNREEERIIRGSESQLLHERGLPTRYGHGLTCDPPPE